MLEAAGKHGPGILVVVVGPSGAGKDTLIDRARAVLQSDPAFHFARRVVTRPASAAEDHATLSSEAFAAARRDGHFALCWRAHGLDYAVPADIDPLIAAGRTVVCNLSRGAVAAARARYQTVRVAFIDAPLAVRMARVASRGRSHEGAERARRDTDFARQDADAVIDNDREIGAATDAFLHCLRGWHAEAPPLSA